MRLIDADKLKGFISDTWILDRIDEQPTVDVEPTEEQVKEYCRKRCLVIVNIEMFNEMTARWSGETVKHGHWDNKIIDARFDVPHTVARCSNCKGKIWVYEENYVVKYPYCPLCGCKMDEVENDT